MEVILNQHSLTHGELTPWGRGRIDLAQFKTSCRKLTNYIIRPQGSISRRPGSKFVTPIKDETYVNTRFIPFIYSDSDATLIEAGEGYFRFHKAGGTVLSDRQFVNGSFTGNITGWTTNSTGTGSATYGTNNAILAGGASGVGSMYQSFTNPGISTYTVTLDVATNPVVYAVGTTIGGSDIATGTLTVGTGKTLTWTPTQNYATVYFTLKNANNNNSTIDNVVLDNPVYEIKTPYGVNTLGFLTYDQAFDTMYMACNSGIRPQELIRQGNDSWVLTPHLFYDGPYFKKSDTTWGGLGTGYTMTISGSASVGSTVTVTCSSPKFTATDVGRWLRYRTLLTDAWGSLEITAYTSATVVTATVKKRLSGTLASTEWSLGMFSSALGFPELCRLFSNRLVWHKTDTLPYHYFFSAADDLANHDPDNAEDKDELDPDTAFTVRGQAQRGSYSYNLIAADRNLFTMSSGGITLMRSNSANEAIAFSNIKIDKILNVSSAPVIPEVVDSVPLFVDQSRRALNEISYSFQEDRFVLDDLTLLSDHATEGLIGQISYSRNPNRVMWVRMLNGDLYTTTYDKGQNITGWSQQVLGGTDVKVEQVTVLPAQDQDEVWLLVSRTINGVTHRYIEYMTKFHTDINPDECKFLDCHIGYTGVPTDNFTGADHLEGEEVQCWGDGAVVPVDGVVAAGAVDLQDEVSDCIVGLPYTSYFEGHNMTSEQYGGALQGRLGRVSEVSIRFFQSYGGEIGLLDEGGTFYIMPEFSSDTLMDTELEFFTGDKKFSTGGRFTTSGRIAIRHALPTPSSIISITYYGSVATR